MVNELEEAILSIKDEKVTEFSEMLTPVFRHIFIRLCGHSFSILDTVSNPIVQEVH